jgi:hypothetical protein
MDSDGYPWYRVVLGTDLAQGDLLERCPVFLPPADLAEPWDEAAFAWQERDVVVMTPITRLLGDHHRGGPLTPSLSPLRGARATAGWPRHGIPRRGGALHPLLPAGEKLPEGRMRNDRPADMADLPTQQGGVSEECPQSSLSPRVSATGASRFSTGA